MQLQKLINKITELSKLWHSNHRNDDSDEDFDARLLIAEYILSKGYDVKIGNHLASRLIKIFMDQTVGQNEEPYCGCEEEMLFNFIQMFANQEHSLGYLVKDEPIEGIYKPVPNVDEDIYVAINYYESKFWPDDISFQYDLEDLDVKE